MSFILFNFSYDIDYFLRRIISINWSCLGDNSSNISLRLTFSKKSNSPFLYLTVRTSFFNESVMVSLFFLHGYVHNNHSVNEYFY